VSPDRRGEVLDATYECLTLYGVRRTTMEDIAQACGMSRAAVYQYVRNKDDAFRGLAILRHEQALQAARAAAAGPGTAAERVHGVLAAKLGLVRAMLTASPHTAELLDEKGRLFGDICTEFGADVAGLIAGLFREAGVDAKAAGEAAETCVALVVGLERHPDAERLLALGSAALVAGLLGVDVR